MIRFYGGRLLRFGGGLRLTDEELWVEGGRIAYVVSRNIMTGVRSRIDGRLFVRFAIYKRAFVWGGAALFYGCRRIFLRFPR